MARAGWFFPLLITYAMMNSAVSEELRSLATWGSTNIYNSQQLRFDVEKLIGSSPRWVKVASLLQADAVWKPLTEPVGRLRIRFSNGWFSCTGFFISEAYAMTNHHCIDHEGRSPIEILMTMNYLDEADPGAWLEVRLDPNAVEADQQLDYAILRPISDVAQFGWLRIQSDVVFGGQQLIIVQHPEGSIKVASIDGCRAAEPTPVVEDDLVHECDTLGGSSGSPVLDASDQSVIALHFGGTVLPEGVRNYARPMNLIIAKSDILGDLAVSRPVPVDPSGARVTSTVRQWCMQYAPGDEWFQTTCQHAMMYEVSGAVKAINQATAAYDLASRAAFEGYVGPRVDMDITGQCYIGALLAEHDRRRGEPWWQTNFVWVKDGNIGDCPGRHTDYITRIREMQRQA